MFARRTTFYLLDTLRGPTALDIHRSPPGHGIHSQYDSRSGQKLPTQV